MSTDNSVPETPTANATDTKQTTTTSKITTEPSNAVVLDLANTGDVSSGITEPAPERPTDTENTVTEKTRTMPPVDALVRQHDDNVVGRNLHPTNTKLNTTLEYALTVLRNVSGYGEVDIAAAQCIFYFGMVMGITGKSVQEGVAFLTNLSEYVFANYETHLTEKYRFRAMNLAKLSRVQFKEFEILLVMLIDTRDPSTRTTAAKGMLFNQMFSMFKNQQAEQMIKVIQQFYNLT